MQMRKLCPNLENEDGLDTVLEVPIPEEIFMSCSSSTNHGYKNSKKGCSSMLSWMKSDDRRPPPSPLGRGSELQLMLGVTGAPLVPVPVISQHSITKGLIMQDPIEASMAKYIVQQYIAACGGKEALNSIKSMYAMGKVRMMSSELYSNNGKEGGKKKVGVKYIGGEIGGFVLWQKRPDLWCLELVVSGCKISAGSDGKVAWRQTPWQPSHASRGPPRPLRRSIQGLDPRSTANLFSSAVCIGEKEINGQDCFVLRLDAEPTTLRARSSGNVEIIRHTLWGYFSERTGLLIQLDDSHLLRMKSSNSDSVYWETTMESSIDDYKFIDGINIAHSGRTQVSLFRYGESSEGNIRSRMEEMWSVEEVDFNIQGLSTDCFMPPSDIVEEKESCDVVVKNNKCKNIRIQLNAIKLGACKVSAVNSEDER